MAPSREAGKKGGSNLKKSNPDTFQTISRCPQIEQYLRGRGGGGHRTYFLDGGNTTYAGREGTLHNSGRDIAQQQDDHQFTI